jgi:anthranilate synthase component 2
MILMIDNYDSFTYNLVQYLGELGAEVETVRNDAVSVDDVVQMKPDGIVISPGPCTPNEAGICVDLVRALAPTIPILGVCLGHQCIGQAFGGARVSSPVCRNRLKPRATIRWCWTRIRYRSVFR